MLIAQIKTIQDISNVMAIGYHGNNLQLFGSRMLFQVMW